MYTVLCSNPPTAIVARLGALWVAVLRFMGSGIESWQVNFFYFISFFVFCNQI